MTVASSYNPVSDLPQASSDHSVLRVALRYTMVLRCVDISVSIKYVLLDALDCKALLYLHK